LGEFLHYDDNIYILGKNVNSKKYY
jgi:hypothetical protein